MTTLVNMGNIVDAVDTIVDWYRSENYPQVKKSGFTPELAFAPVLVEGARSIVWQLAVCERDVGGYTPLPLALCAHEDRNVVAKAAEAMNEEGLKLTPSEAMAIISSTMGGKRKGKKKKKDR